MRAACTDHEGLMDTFSHGGRAVDKTRALKELNARISKLVDPPVKVDELETLRLMEKAGADTEKLLPGLLRQLTREVGAPPALGKAASAAGQSEEVTPRALCQKLLA